MKVLVTGAAGFIGRHLCAALAGHEVVATDMADAPHVHDVRAIPRELMAGCDVVIHGGGVSGPMVLADRPAEVIDINVAGTARLLEMARDLGVGRFIGLSSVSVYGDADGIVTEDAPLRATNAYGSSKAAADLLIRTYARYGLDTVALRIGWAYGPGRVTDALIQPVVRGEPVAAGGAHPLQFVHVDDVIRAVQAAMTRGTSGAAYNIDGAEVLTVQQICAMIADVPVGPGLLPGVDLQGPMDLSAAARDLGWAPQVPFADGLADWVAALRAA